MGWSKMEYSVIVANVLKWLRFEMCHIFTKHDVRGG